MIGARVGSDALERLHVEQSIAASMVCVEQTFADNVRIQARHVINVSTLVLAPPNDESAEDVLYIEQPNAPVASSGVVLTVATDRAAMPVTQFYAFPCS